MVTIAELRARNNKMTQAQLANTDELLKID